MLVLAAGIAPVQKPGVSLRAGRELLVLWVAAPGAPSPAVSSGLFRASPVLQAHLLPNFNLLQIELLLSSDLGTFIGMSCASCLGTLGDLLELRIEKASFSALQSETNAHNSDKHLGKEFELISALPC